MLQAETEDLQYLFSFAENNNGMSADAIVASCAADAVRAEIAVNPFLLYRHVNWSSDALEDCPSSRAGNRITVGVHVSLDSISSLEKSLQNWGGLVSLAVFVRVANLTEGLSEWQRFVIAAGRRVVYAFFPFSSIRLYLDKKIKNMSMPKCSRVTFVLGQETEVTDYPISHLRNAVIRNVLSQFVLLIDADFQVSPGLEMRFHESVDMSAVSLKAFVVPAFEWLEAGQASRVSKLVSVITGIDLQRDVVQSKTELIQLIFREDPLVQPFQSYDDPENHKLTNYFKWYYSNKMYPVRGFSDMFEPYLIVE